MYCTILDAQTIISGFGPFGAVKDGYLKISGLVLEADLLRAVDHQSPKHPWRVNIEGQEIARADLDVEKNEPLLGAKERKSWAVLVAKCLGTKSPPQGHLLHKTGRQPEMAWRNFSEKGFLGYFPYLPKPKQHSPYAGSISKTANCKSMSDMGDYALL